MGLIGRTRPVILVENHLFVRRTIQSEVNELLQSLGYRHVHTHPHHSVSHSRYEP